MILEETNPQQPQQVSMEHNSVYGEVAATIGAIGATVALFNNGYRAGRMGNLFKKGKNAEMVQRLVNGEKIAGNFKIPFTDLPTRFGIGEKINVTLNGTSEAVGGWGYSKAQHGIFGIKEGQGLGYNFSFDKKILGDIENGTINKELLKKNFAEKHTIQNADGTFKKMKKRNLTKEEFAELLNSSVDTEKRFINEGGKAVLRRAQVDSFSNDFVQNAIKINPELKAQEKELFKIFKETTFKSQEKTKLFEASISKNTMTDVFSKIEKQGIKIAKEDIAKITEKTLARGAKQYAAKSMAKAGAKYAALAPMLAAGPLGAAVAGAIGTAFVAFDVITGIKALDDVNKMAYDAKKEKNKNLSIKGRSENFERASNKTSLSAMSGGFQTLQQANFGLGNLIRTKNMAGSFLSDKLWG